jgi:hypothetical protein
MWDFIKKVIFVELLAKLGLRNPGDSDGTIIIELDGRVHNVKVAKTDERNKLFRDAGIKLIVLNIADIGYHDETIWERCDFELMSIVGKRNLPEYDVE